MFQINNYAEFQRRQAQLIKKAEIERQLRQAESDKSGTVSLSRMVASWLGLHLIQWGQKLKQMSASHNRQHTTSISTRSSSL
jgi:hypothetical protein